MPADTMTHESTPVTMKGAMPGLLGSRPLARLLSPVVAILPWWVTVFGIAQMRAWRTPLPGTQDLALILTVTVSLLVAAMVWALVTAWSSTGPLVAGWCTLVTSWILASDVGRRILLELTISGGVDFMRTVDWLAQPVFALIVGSFLIAAGLGAAGARRLRG